MNERIKELAEQSGIHFHKGGTLDAGPNGIAKFVLYSDMEKFAELIVRECAKIADDCDELKCEWIGGNILTYFGVKE
jgi:hypothetical protein